MKARFESALLINLGGNAPDWPTENSNEDETNWRYG